MTTLAPRTVVRLPHGEEGVITPAPEGDWLAPGEHKADVNGPVVWIEWTGWRGRTYGCWWRPEALKPVNQAVRERTSGGRR